MEDGYKKSTKFAILRLTVDLQSSKTKVVQCSRSIDWPISSIVHKASEFLLEVDFTYRNKSHITMTASENNVKPHVQNGAGAPEQRPWHPQTARFFAPRCVPLSIRNVGKRVRVNSSHAHSTGQHTCEEYVFVRHQWPPLEGEQEVWHRAPGHDVRMAVQVSRKFRERVKSMVHSPPPCSCHTGTHRAVLVTQDKFQLQRRHV